MAFVRGRSKTDNPMIASGGAAAGIASGSPAGGAASQQPNTPGSGFVNIERYLNANDPTKMGEAVGGQVAEKGQAAKEAIGAFESDAIPQPNFMTDSAARPSYSGPDNWSTMPSYSPALKATQDWQQYQANLGSEGGLMSMAGGSSPINRALNAGMLMTQRGREAIGSKASPFANIGELLKGAEVAKGGQITKAKESADVAGKAWDKARDKEKADKEIAARQAEIDAENKRIEDAKAAALKKAATDKEESERIAKQKMANVEAAGGVITNQNIEQPGQLIIGNNPLPPGVSWEMPVVNNNYSGLPGSLPLMYSQYPNLYPMINRG